MLPAEAGTNCWTMAEDLLANELSKLSTLQAFLGVADDEAARNGNMFIDSIGRAPEEYSDAEWFALFPNVLIGSPGEDDGVLTLTNRSTGPDFGATGIVEIVFSRQLTAGAESDQEREFKNKVGDILQQFTDSPLDVPEFKVVAYGRNPVDEHERMGVIQSAMVYVKWGTVSTGED